MSCVVIVVEILTVGYVGFRYDDRRDEAISRSSREQPAGRDVNTPRDRDDRRFDDRRSGPSDRNFER